MEEKFSSYAIVQEIYRFRQTLKPFTNSAEFSHHHWVSHPLSKTKILSQQPGTYNSNNMMRSSFCCILLKIDLVFSKLNTNIFIPKFRKKDVQVFVNHLIIQLTLSLDWVNLPHIIIFYTVILSTQTQINFFLLIAKFLILLLHDKSELQIKN